MALEWQPRYPDALPAQSWQPPSGSLAWVSFLPLPESPWRPHYPDWIPAPPLRPWLSQVNPQVDLSGSGSWTAVSWLPSYPAWFPPVPWVWSTGPLAAEALIVIAQRFPWPLPVEVYAHPWRPFTGSVEVVIQGPWPCVHLRVTGQTPTSLLSWAQTETTLTTTVRTSTTLTNVEVC